MKPSFAIQWHITDECDQRCKHCYIFSEGCAQLHSTPLGQVERIFTQCMEMCGWQGDGPPVTFSSVR